MFSKCKSCDYCCICCDKMSCLVCWRHDHFNLRRHYLFCPTTGTPIDRVEEDKRIYHLELEEDDGK